MVTDGDNREHRVLTLVIRVLSPGKKTGKPLKNH